MVDSLKPILKTVVFSSVEQWDIKRFISTSISSKFKIHKLSKFINNEAKKTKLFDFPTEKFKILGISNETGMFDAYEEIGANINQPYIEVKNDFLAYNPYRINVGSIGIKTEALKHNYISPAYVVFSCTQELSPKFLFLLMKSNAFNEIIRDNTTGSVRQTLSFNNLEKIKVPIPNTIEEQNALVKKYENALDEAEHCEKEAEHLKASIEEYLFNVLGIQPLREQVQADRLLVFTSLNKLFKWGADYNINAVNPKNIFLSTKYKNVSILNYCEINPTTKYPDSIEDISFIPMECVSDIDGEIAYKKEGKVMSAKGYTRFQENDVIWAKITPCMQNGKSAVAKKLLNGFAYGSTEYHVFRAFENKALPEYIHCFLRTNRIRKIAQAYFTGSAGQQRVGSDFLEQLTLPLLPVSSTKNMLSQVEIVDHIIEIKDQIKTLRQKAGSLRERAKKEFEEAVFSQ